MVGEYCQNQPASCVPRNRKISARALKSRNGGFQTADLVKGGLRPPLLVFYRAKISLPATYVRTTSSFDESTTKSASLPIAISPFSGSPASRAGLRDAIA